MIEPGLEDTVDVVCPGAVQAGWITAEVGTECHSSAVCYLPPFLIQRSVRLGSDLRLTHASVFPIIPSPDIDSHH
jgi:hypothetical protein